MKKKTVFLYGFIAVCMGVIIAFLYTFGGEINRKVQTKEGIKVMFDAKKTGKKLIATATIQNVSGKSMDYKIHPCAIPFNDVWPDETFRDKYKMVSETIDGKEAGDINSNVHCTSEEHVGIVTKTLLPKEKIILTSTYEEKYSEKGVHTFEVRFNKHTFTFDYRE